MALFSAALESFTSTSALTISMFAAVFPVTTINGKPFSRTVTTGKYVNFGDFHTQSGVDITSENLVNSGDSKVGRLQKTSNL